MIIFFGAKISIIKCLYKIEGTLYELIKVEKKNNEELKDRLGMVKNQNNASNEMIQNYKQIYNTKNL